MSLSIYTTQQLIEELLSRPTWAGIVIRADKEIKTSPTRVKDFILDTQNLNVDETHTILSQAVKLLGQKVHP